MSGRPGSGDEDSSSTLRRAWELSLHLLASKVSQVTFATYLHPTVPLSYDDNTVTLGVGSAFAREWLEKRAANSIRSALEFHLDTTELQIRFVVLSRDQLKTMKAGQAAVRKQDARPQEDPQATLPLDSEQETAAAGARTTQQEETAPRPAAAPARTKSSGGGRSEKNRAMQEPAETPCLPLNARYTFADFLVGPSNRFAYAGAMRVASQPGGSYNPLFLYGGPGLGKTHLMQAIANMVRTRNPVARVAYVSGEFFAQQYIAAIREHCTEQFRRQYRDVDLWLVDDIQFIASKEHTKEEFFHTFNTLYQTGRQIVLTSDRSPRELNTMDERLRSRFQSGLIADIEPPELETRIAFLQLLREREQVSILEEVLDYIAAAIQSNMRALEGALTKLVAYSSIMNAPICLELAQRVLGEYFIEKPIQRLAVTPDSVIESVAQEFGVAAAAITGPARNKDISLARHVAMYLCRQILSDRNTTQVGAAFGGRDHATIVYACQKVRTLLTLDPELRALTERLIQQHNAQK